MPEINHERLPNREAIAQFGGKVPLTTQHYAELKAYEHALAFTVAGLADKDMLTEVHKAMKQAMTNGTSFSDFKKQLKPYLMAKGWLAPTFKNDNVDDDKAKFTEYQKQLGHRLRTIYHTNKATAYSAGQWERIQRTKELLPYLQYMPSVSTNKRDEHKRYYRLVRPVDDPIWQSIFPPNSWGCKCWVKQLTRTKAQKILDEQAKEGKTYDIEMEEVKYPLTGEMMSVPKGVHFSFNHNHDRLTALLRLAQDKHGAKFAEELGLDLKDGMLSYAVKAGIAHQKLSHILPNSQNALNLAKDPNGKSRLAEGVLADQWEQFHKVKLERYDGGKHKVLVQNDPADYAIVDLAQEPTAWVTLDLMFTLEPDANKAEFNRSFYKSDKAWEKRQKRILQHLAKADLVPMYLKHLDNQALVKIIGFVLSLPKELQEKIILIN